MQQRKAQPGTNGGVHRRPVVDMAAAAQREEAARTRGARLNAIANAREAVDFARVPEGGWA